MSERLLTVEGLRVGFSGVSILRGIDLAVDRGETLGIVGETGCGKSVLSLTILGLAAGATIEGTLRYGDLDLRRLTSRQWEDVRGRRIGMIFQDPFTALNPVFTLRDQLGAVLTRHFGLRGAALERRILDWMPRVGLPGTSEFISRYPHRLSGGQRQRVAIALALAGEPDLLFADEPTTALDVTVQAQILELLQKLQAETGVAVVFISHDLGVIGDLCHRTAVMYAGRIVEEGPTQALFAHPRHPYTHGLFAARRLLGRGERLEAIPGSVPSPRAFPSGCAFHPRCSRCLPRCETDVPDLSRQEDIEVACFHPHE